MVASSLNGGMVIWCPCTRVFGDPSNHECTQDPCSIATTTVQHLYMIIFWFWCLQHSNWQYNQLHELIMQMSQNLLSQKSVFSKQVEVERVGDLLCYFFLSTFFSCLPHWCRYRGLQLEARAPWENRWDTWELALPLDQPNVRGFPFSSLSDISAGEGEKESSSFRPNFSGLRDCGFQSHWRKCLKGREVSVYV